MQNKQGGFIRGIILIVILIGVLSYFHISIRAIIESDAFKENFGYVWGWVKYVWGTYLSSPANYLWNDVFIKLIWEAFIQALQAFKSGAKPPMLNGTGW